MFGTEKGRNDLSFYMHMILSLMLITIKLLRTGIANWLGQNGGRALVWFLFNGWFLQF
jgi:hypothetical protein